MAFVNSALVILNQPTGFWESILNAFKGATGTYILAVILLAVILRLLFSLVDVINKRLTAKNTAIQTKMNPELEAVKKKYANDPKMLQQKQSEIYKKYQFNMMGSCLPMLIVMILQFTVFLTLWNSLQAVSNYNIANQYQEMKNIYASVLAINEITVEEGELSVEKLYNEEGLTKISIKILDGKEKSLEITCSNEETGETKQRTAEYKKLKNKEIYRLATLYGGLEEPKKEEPEDEVTAKEVTLTEFQTVIKELAEEMVKDYYLETQEGFLWIKNIYKAESPASPTITLDDVRKNLPKYYSEEEAKDENELDVNENKMDYEGKLFPAVVAKIDQTNVHNGYYILTIIAVLTSVLSLWLSNFLMRNKNAPAQKQPWLMYVIMPLIMGIFTFTYTSLFAIYIIVGQLMMLLLTPLTTLVVKKWNKVSDDKKKDKNIIEVDYRRKDF